MAETAIDVSASAQRTVYFDGACPICRVEIDFYQRLDRENAVVWQDISELEEAALPSGKSRAELLGAMHVRGCDGNWHIGVAGFAETWRGLPVFRWFAWVFSVPGLRHLAELFYRVFLAWQRRDRARREKAKVASK